MMTGSALAQMVFSCWLVKLCRLGASVAPAFFLNFAKSVDGDERVRADNLSEGALPPRRRPWSLERKVQITLETRGVQASTVPKIVAVRLFTKKTINTDDCVCSHLGGERERRIVVVIMLTHRFPGVVFRQVGTGCGNYQEFFTRGGGSYTRRHRKKRKKKTSAQKCSR